MLRRFFSFVLAKILCPLAVVYRRHALLSPNEQNTSRVKWRSIATRDSTRGSPCRIGLFRWRSTRARALYEYNITVRRLRLHAFPAFIIINRALAARSPLVYTSPFCRGSCPFPFFLGFYGFSSDDDCHRFNRFHEWNHHHPHRHIYHRHHTNTHIHTL